MNKQKRRQELTMKVYIVFMIAPFVYEIMDAYYKEENAHTHCERDNKKMAKFKKYKNHYTRNNARWYYETFDIIQ